MPSVHIEIIETHTHIVNMDPYPNNNGFGPFIYYGALGIFTYDFPLIGRTPGNPNVFFTPYMDSSKPYQEVMKPGVEGKQLEGIQFEMGTRSARLVDIPDEKTVDIYLECIKIWNEGVRYGSAGRKESSILAKLAKQFGIKQGPYHANPIPVKAKDGLYLIQNMQYTTKDMQKTDGKIFFHPLRRSCCCFWGGSKRYDEVNSETVRGITGRLPTEEDTPHGGDSLTIVFDQVETADEYESEKIESFIKAYRDGRHLTFMVWVHPVHGRPRVKDPIAKADYIRPQGSEYYVPDRDR